MASLYDKLADACGIRVFHVKPVKSGTEPKTEGLLAENGDLNGSNQA